MMTFKIHSKYTTIDGEAYVVTASKEEEESNTATPASPLIAASPHWNVLTSTRSQEEAGFTPFVAFCFTINYILGTGFLTIPWAFVQSGLALSCILLVISAFISDMAKDYLLETMARAEAMLDHNMHWIPYKDKDTAKLLISPAKIDTNNGTTASNQTDSDSDDDEDGDEEEPKPTKQIKRQGSFQNNNNKTKKKSSTSSSKKDKKFPHSYHRKMIKIRTSPAPRKYLVRDRKFEVNTLCRVFLGKKGVAAFTLFICLYIIGLLWAYTSVFASAMTRALPIYNTDDNQSYIFYAILFGIVVVPLSCLELQEQVTVQVIMTACRFLMLFLMIFTSHKCANESGEWYEEDNNNNDAPMFRFQGLHRTLPILVVANMYHHSIPGLSDPVANKKALGSIFRSTSIFTSFAYSVIGVILGSAFGKSIEQSSNLNWRGFGSDSGGSSVVSWWAEIVSFYIILFPALDVVSAFPLNAITLGNNMFGAYYGSRVHEVENNRCARICFRLLASIPPIIGGIFIRELGTITDYTGTTGFVIGFSIPALLFIHSKRLAKRKQYSPETFYTSYASWGLIPEVVLWFGIVMVILVLISLVFIR